MTNIDYQKTATDIDLFHEFKRYMQEYFNIRITKEQFLDFVDLCEQKRYYLNPFQMCSWVLNKPVKVIEDRWYQKRSKDV